MLDLLVHLHPHQIAPMRPDGVVARIGYEFLCWFKSLAALGCPAPRVLAALRAARRTEPKVCRTRSAATRLEGSARW